LAALATRHHEFLAAGARLFAITVDSPPQNSFVMTDLALPFPLLSDPDRASAITPLGFADEKDPRLISRPGSIVVAPGGAETWRYLGRDYADRPHEDLLLDEVAGLGLPAIGQDTPEVGDPVRGPNGTSTKALPTYFRGSKFAALALRGRYRTLGDEFRDDIKRHAQMTDRYIEAISAALERRA
jgi:hypothetical protein